MYVKRAPLPACSSAEEAVKNADVVFTQTTGSEWVLEEDWLRPHVTIIASGSDQPTKNELPPSVMSKAKFVTDITAQCSRVGELRSAIKAGVMTADDVHAEIGQIISGEKPGRIGNELIVCDLTGTGAQDAAIGSYAMKVLDGVVPGGSPPLLVANKPRLPAPKLYDYDTIKSRVAPSRELTEAVEDAFSQLANGKVDVPLPMHIGVAETPEAGPGDCHIKGGYIEGAPTWTVKLAMVSFYNNLKKGLPAGSGVFVVCDASNGGPIAVLHENRYLTDMRTGAAGAVCVKHLAPNAKSVAFIGTGVIAEAMARATATVHGFEQGYGYSRDMAKNSAFCNKMSAELGYAFTPCSSAEEAVKNADVVFTQTTGSEWVLDLKWLQPHALIIASGSDQPTKNEIPPTVMQKARVVTDITAQCLRVGELRSAVKAGVMKETDVHAQLGEVINGSKKGRSGKELIVCDLTGTGAQDAAIGSYVMKVLN